MLGGYLNETDNFKRDILEDFLEFIRKKNNNLNKKSSSGTSKKADLLNTTKEVTPIIFKQAVDAVKHSGDTKLTTELFKFVNSIFNKMDRYLYIYAPNKYIEEILGEKSNYEILNPYDYVIDTVVKNPDSNLYSYYIIDEKGSINKLAYYGRDIYQNAELQNILCVVDDGSRFASLYASLFDDFDSYHTEIESYLKKCNASKPFGGLPICGFFNSLFYLGNNDTLLANKSYDNIIGQIVHTGTIDKLFNIIDILLEDHIPITDITPFNVPEDVMTDLVNTGDHNNIQLINNISFEKIKEEMISLIHNTKNADTPSTSLVNLYQKLFKKYYYKDEKNAARIMQLIKRIDDTIEEQDLANEYLISTYNVSTILNLQKNFDTLKDNRTKLNYMGRIANLFKFSDMDRPKIKLEIKAKIINMFLPLILFPYFTSDKIIQYIMLYILNILETGSNYKNNNKYIFDKIFGKKFKVDSKNTECVAYLDTLQQCYTNYYKYEKQIKHPTCAESTLLNLLKNILVKKGIVDLTKLNKHIKSTTEFHKSLINFFTNFNTMPLLRTKDACNSFAQLVSNIDGIDYASFVQDYRYNLIPEFKNMMKLFFFITTGRIIAYDDAIEYEELLKELSGQILVNDTEENMVVIELKNIKCTFTPSHAYVGEGQSADEIDNEGIDSLYGSLYFNKFGKKIIGDKIKEINFVENLLHLMYNTNFNYIDYGQVLADIPDNIKGELGKIMKKEGILEGPDRDEFSAAVFECTSTPKFDDADEDGYVDAYVNYIYWSYNTFMTLPEFETALKNLRSSIRTDTDENNPIGTSYLIQFKPYIFFLNANIQLVLKKILQNDIKQIVYAILAIDNKFKNNMGTYLKIVYEYIMNNIDSLIASNTIIPNMEILMMLFNFCNYLLSAPLDSDLKSKILQISDKPDDVSKYLKNIRYYHYRLVMNGVTYDEFDSLKDEIISELENTYRIPKLNINLKYFNKYELILTTTINTFRPTYYLTFAIYEIVRIEPIYHGQFGSGNIGTKGPIMKNSYYKYQKYKTKYMQLKNNLGHFES